MKGLDDNRAYLDTLAKRAKESRVHRDFQLIGLEVADLLGDRRHKALYIKLAKAHGTRLLEIAKSVAERRDIKNRGAYFMKVLKENSVQKK